MATELVVRLRHRYDLVTEEGLLDDLLDDLASLGFEDVELLEVEEV